MTTPPADRIAGLLDRLQAAVESPVNVARRTVAPPTFRIGLEDRVMTSLYAIDFRRLYSDAMFNFEHQYL